MQRQIQLGERAIVAEVADTPAARELGLSGRASLGAEEGLLFVFEKDDYWGIWMKEMRFSIDIVWIAADGRVVTIVRGATPESYPDIFVPSSPARYVLELPAGSAAEHALAEGAKIVL